MSVNNAYQSERFGCISTLPAAVPTFELVAHEEGHQVRDVRRSALAVKLHGSHGRALFASRAHSNRYGLARAHKSGDVLARALATGMGCVGKESGYSP